MKIKVIMGSARESRFSEKPGPWILGELNKQEGIEAELLDLRDYPMPFFEEAATPSMKQEPYKHPVVKKWTAKIAEADGFVIVTPEYNHGYPAVLKNALDYVYQEWNNKPVGFVSYGSVAGARSVEQLRLVAIELQMAPIRAAIHLPVDKWAPVWLGKAPAEDLFAAVAGPAQAFIEQLMWWTKALKTARQ